MSFRSVQSRSASFAEAGTNVAVGYLVALAAQQLVFPLFGIRTTLAEDSAIAALFTLISVLRSYVLRRLFERIGAGRGESSWLKSGRLYRLVEDG